MYNIYIYLKMEIWLFLIVLVSGGCLCCLLCWKNVLILPRKYIISPPPSVLPWFFLIFPKYCKVGRKELR